MKTRHYIITKGFNAGTYYGHNVKVVDKKDAEFSFLAPADVDPTHADQDFGTHHYITIAGIKYPLKTENT